MRTLKLLLSLVIAIVSVRAIVVCGQNAMHIKYELRKTLGSNAGLSFDLFLIGLCFVILFCVFYILAAFADKTPPSR